MGEERGPGERWWGRGVMRRFSRCTVVFVCNWLFFAGGIIGISALPNRTILFGETSHPRPLVGWLVGRAE